MLYRLATLAAVLVAPTVILATAPDDPPPTPDALQRELASLQTRIRELEFRQTAVDDEVVRQTASQVAADALDFGCVAQAAYLHTDRCEGFVRYSLTEFDNPPAGIDNAIHEICVGANYYLIPAAPHRAKVTVDLTYLPNGAPPSLAPFGISGDTDDAELVLRGQFQLFL